MSIQLDKQVEDEEENSCRPTQREKQPAFFWAVKARNSEETVRHKITHQDQIYNAPEDKPRVVLEWSLFELVVLWNLGLHLSLEKLIDRWMWVLASLGVLKDMRVLRPKDEAIVFGLNIQKPADACIVCSAPEEKNYGEDGYAGAFGQ